jgi:dethiobiotin synthetase
MKIPKGIFVGGTGTGVGKTVFSVMLSAWLQSKGLKVAPMKPAETGCSPAPGDALALLAAADVIYPIEDVCPYRLALAAAPEAAARAAHVSIEMTVIRRSFDRLAEKADVVVVEGAGAVATPYAPRLTGVEIARKLGLPVILVTGETLGTIGQTLAAARALRYSRVPCRGVVLSVTSPRPTGPHGDSNASLLASHLGSTPFLGTLPHLLIREGSIGAMPCTLVSGWAKENLQTFDGALGGALEKTMTPPPEEGG